MVTEELLPPACAFAASVLAERDADPEAVPEEAVEAAEQHINTCVRCLSDNNLQGILLQATHQGTPLRRKKKVRRPIATDAMADSPLPSVQSPEDQSPQPLGADTFAQRPMAGVSTLPVAQNTQGAALQSVPPTTPPPQRNVALQTVPLTLPVVSKLSAAQTPLSSALGQSDGPITCLQCRQILNEYAEAMDGGQNVALLYPTVHEHLLTCESGCLVLLDLFRQEARASRKHRRRPVHNPFRVIGWELTGFFRGGIIPISPRALAFGTLILFLLIAPLSVYLSIHWDDARYYHPVNPHIVPTPDGIGLSDGLAIYDACNASSYQDKRQAAQAMKQNDLSKATSLLTAATNVVTTDTTGCNGAEAAIYAEDLQVRLSGRPFGLIVVSFDSGPGNADPTGGTDRHILYAAYTQELVGAFIGQQQYNSTQMQTPGAPLLYLVLANTSGSEQGALQVANEIAALTTSTDLQQMGLLASGKAPLLAVLGLGPSSLVQLALPTLCRAGVPLIAPTATGVFIIDLLSQTSLYRHCAPGFAFIRFSPDDAHQSALGASYAYYHLSVHNAAIFYDPSNPSSTDSAVAFRDTFNGFLQRSRKHTIHDAHIVAEETIVASGLLDANGRPQASRKDLLAGLDDALHTQPRPDLIFAPLLTNDVITLAQAIAHLPQNQQPILMIGGEFVQPTALQGLVVWTRQQQLSLPRVFVALSSAARPPTNGNWQRQFYAAFCTSFATPGSFCSGAAALDQGALFFGDGVEIVAQGVGSITEAGGLPTTRQLVGNIVKEKFAGVSSPIALHRWDEVLVTSIRVSPVILGIQEDGSLQIVS